MFSLPLFKKTLKSNYLLLTFFLLLLTMYFTIITGMFDPNDLDILNQLASLKLSPDLLNAFGFNLIDTSLTGFLSSYFYGLIMPAFPMVAGIILCNSLIAKQVDRGSMAALLSTPISRVQIAFTQGIFAVVSMFVIVGYVTVLGIAYCEALFPGLLDINAFILLNIGMLLTHLAISGVCFFASCLFNETRWSLMLGAGLPVFFLLVQMLGNANSKLEWLPWLSIFTLFQPLDIIHGDASILPFISLGVIAVTLYGGGIAVFNKKDLPI